MRHWLGLLLLLAAPLAAAESGAVTVITAAEIARERPADLIALLRSRVGLDVTGGNVSMRGVRGVVFVLDGFTVTVEEMGQVRPEQVRRLEIRRGAASARFGADAMGGAVVVTTRRAGGEGRRSLAAGVDSSGSRFGRLAGGRAAGAFSFSGLAEYRLVDGFRRVTDSPYAYNVTVEDERYEKTLIDATAGWRGAGAALELNLKHRNNLANLGRPHWWWDDRETALRASGRWAPRPGLRIDGRLGWRDYADEALKDAGTGLSGAGLEPALRFFTDSRTGEGELGADLDLARGTLSAMLSASRERGEDRILDEPGGSESFRLRATTDNLALAAGWEGALAEPVRLTLGLRHDRYRYHGIEVYNAASEPTAFSGDVVNLQAFNGKAALDWRFAPGTGLGASVGTGFLPPTPGQLYYAELNEASWFLPNPELSPQHSLTADLTLAHETAAGATFKATVFHTRWRDKIGPLIVDYGTPVVRQYQNIGAAESNGLELEARRALGAQWALTLNYTFNRTRITRDAAHPGYVGNELPDMPRHKLNLGLEWSGAGRWSGRLLARYAGASWTDEANTGTDAAGHDWRKGAYATLDATLVGRLGDFELALAGDNLFDRRYRSGFFWRDEGRVLRAELTWNF